MIRSVRLAPALALVLLASTAAAQERGRLAKDHDPNVVDPNTLSDLHVATIEADLIALATIQEVEPSPNCWSEQDRQPCLQEVELRLDTVWKGPLKPEIRLEVDFPLVEGSPTASTLGPALDPGLFAMGQQVVVFLDQRPDVARQSDEAIDDNEQEDVWVALNADFGALPLSKAEEVRRLLGL